MMAEADAEEAKKKRPPLVIKAGMTRDELLAELKWLDDERDALERKRRCIQTIVNECLLPDVPIGVQLGLVKPEDLL